MIFKKNNFKYNRYKNFVKVLIPFFLISIIFCKQESRRDIHHIQLSGIHKVLFFNKKEASKAIVKDDIDSFFNKVNRFDMMVQMKRYYPDSTSQETILNEYKSYIQNDVEDFTERERAFLSGIFVEAFQLCRTIAYKQFPEEINIIKTIGRHYGDGVYYTRENSIVIPQNMLKELNHDDMLHIVLHEISHIITRLHPALKVKLYSLIGFKKAANPLIINDLLKSKILTNPDGVDNTWVTNMKDETGKNIYALPIIYSKDSLPNKVKKEFMQFFNWNFFELAPSVDGSKLAVVTGNNLLQSTLNTVGITEIFKKNYNTAYIIHPDEIIADNFMYMIYTQKDSTDYRNFTEGGKLLLSKMKEVFAGDMSPTTTTAPTRSSN